MGSSSSSSSNIEILSLPKQNFIKIFKAYIQKHLCNEKEPILKVCISSALGNMIYNYSQINYKDKEIDEFIVMTKKYYNQYFADHLRIINGPMQDHYMESLTIERLECDINYALYIYSQSEELKKIILDFTAKIASDDIAKELVLQEEQITEDDKIYFIGVLRDYIEEHTQTFNDADDIKKQMIALVLHDHFVTFKGFREKDCVISTFMNKVEKYFVKSDYDSIGGKDKIASGIAIRKVTKKDIIESINNLMESYNTITTMRSLTRH